MAIVLQSVDDASIGVMTSTERALVNRLRVLLRDGENLQMRTLNTLVERQRGRRWSDEVLLVCLQQAMWMINGAPPYTAFTIEDIPGAWQGVLCLGGMIYALFGEAIVQNGENFSYSDNGIALNIAGISQGYAGLAGQMLTAFNGQVEAMKKAMRPAARGIKSSPAPITLRSYAQRMWVYR